MNWLLWVTGVLVCPGLVYMVVVQLRLAVLRTRGEVGPFRGKLYALWDLVLSGLYLYALSIMVRHFPWGWPMQAP